MTVTIPRTTGLKQTPTTITTAKIAISLSDKSVILTSPSSDTPSYEEFKEIVREELEKTKELTWSEIRARRSEFHQKVPNNLWVRMLEREIGLIREKQLNGRTIWRLKHA